MLLGKNNNSMLLLLCSHRWTDEMDKKLLEYVFFTSLMRVHTVCSGCMLSTVTSGH